MPGLGLQLTDPGASLFSAAICRHMAVSGLHLRTFLVWLHLLSPGDFILGAGEPIRYRFCICMRCGGFNGLAGFLLGDGLFEKSGEARDGRGGIRESLSEKKLLLDDTR